tara:strand:- start:54562 stop:55578 length:1017 start_codon:yes stop_codon:yes gene_type:complete
MMLQGHFISALLSDDFESDSAWFHMWKDLRGMTAPVFFTVSGFIFTYLLLKQHQSGGHNPRVRKGVVRGIQLMGIGYLLQINFKGLLDGQLNSSWQIVHVLQCIGMSLLLIIVSFLVTRRFKKWVFPYLLMIIGMFLFLFEYWYATWDTSWMPSLLANYFTRENGSVFTIFPWFGYAAFGGFMSALYLWYGNGPKFNFRALVITSVLGILLSFWSYYFFSAMATITQNDFFMGAYKGSDLFARFGDVLLVFVIFRLLERFLKHPLIHAIGKNTLAIYVIHSILLYGSFTGWGIKQFLYHSLEPVRVVLSALLFLVVTTVLALAWDRLPPLRRIFRSRH